MRLPRTRKVQVKQLQDLLRKRAEENMKVTGQLWDAVEFIDMVREGWRPTKDGSWARKIKSGKMEVQRMTDGQRKLWLIGGQDGS